MRTTRHLWHALIHPNDYAPLYFHLRMSYRPYRRWGGYDFNLPYILSTLFNVFLAPFMSLIPPIAIFVLGTYLAGFVAGHIQREHNHHRFDLLALLPGGAGDVYWTLAVIHMRESTVYQYVVDGLRLTALIGSMVVFVLISGLSIGFFQPGLATSELLELINATLTIALIFAIVYIQQMQSVILSQTLGMALTTYTEQVAEARVGASLVFLTIQIMTYALFFYLVFGGVPQLTPETFPLTSTLSLVLGGGVLITMQELCIVFMWRRLQTVYGSINLERLIA